jgi:DNA repair protein RAD50
LEYVVFCHQEEAMWPFDDSKKLKEKFDEIFQSAEYVKVMLSLKNERKSQLESYKSTLKDTEKFKVYVDFKDESKAKIASLENEVEECEGDVKSLIQAIEPKRKQLEACQMKAVEYRSLKIDYETVQARLRALTDDIKTLESKSGKFLKYILILITFVKKLHQV